MSVKKYLLKTMAEDKEDLIKSFHSLASAQSVLADGRAKPAYKVSIMSYWSAYGECTVEIEGKPGESIQKVLKRTEIEFMNRNKRSDVQGGYSVSALIRYGCGPDSYEEIPLPEKFFIKYKLGNRK
jgi:hypothetical protein